jgi:hypothetical protein
MSGLSRLAIWAGRTFVAISVPQIPTRADYHSTKFWVPEQKNFVYMNRPGFRSYCFPCVAVANTGSCSA